MRISSEQSEKKRTFIRGLVTANINITHREIQEQVKAQFGQNVRPNTITEIREEVAKSNSPVVTTPAPEAVGVDVTAPAPQTLVVTEGPVSLAPETALPVPAPHIVNVHVVQETIDAKGTRMHETVDVQGTHVEIRPGLVEVTAV